MFEHPGEQTFPVSCFVVKRGGMVVFCAGTTGYNLTMDARFVWMRQKRIQGSHFANLLQASQANQLVIERRIDPCMSEVFDWADIPAAHTKMWKNQHKPGNMAVLVSAKRPGLPHPRRRALERLMLLERMRARPRLPSGAATPRRTRSPRARRSRGLVRARAARSIPPILEREQFAAHGFAWIATYVAALRADAATGPAGSTRRGKLGELELLMLQSAFGEYLAQLAGGIAMSQVEIVRPGDLGLDARDAATRRPCAS